MKKKLSIAILLVGLIMGTFTSYASAATFSRGRIIDDAVFDNANSLTASQIDAFLNSFPNSCISTNNGFAAIDPIGYNPTDGFLYGGNVSAGNVIYHAAQAYSLNPQVLLTTLQKEQSLVNGGAGCTTNRYAKAMGYGCPDSGGSYSYSGVNLYTKNGVTYTSVSGVCVNSVKKVGFTQQVIRAAWLLKFSEQRSKGNIGWAVVKGNWNNSDDLNATYSGPMTQGCFKRSKYDSQCTYFDGYITIDSTAVHIDTGGTAALYWYTPHFSGNQNFFNIFTTWFGSTIGSILFQVSGSATYYLDWGSYYYPIPSEVVLYAYGLEGIAPRTISTLPSGETQGPLLSISAKFGSDNSSDPDYTATVNLVEGGQKHAAPNWDTLGAFGVSSYDTFPASLNWVLKNGDALRPVVRKPNGAIYLIQNDKKRGFPDWETFANLSGPNYVGSNQVYSEQSLTNMSAFYINSIPVGAPMLLDGKTVKSSTSAGIYLYDSGKKYGHSASSYAAWGGGLNYTFTQTEIDQITDGGAAPLLVGSTGGSKYLVDSGKKKLFTPTLETAWGFTDDQFKQITDRSLARLQNATASNLITPGAGVYYISGGYRHGVGSAIDFAKLGFSWSNVDTVGNTTLSLLPQGATLFAPGRLLRTPDGAVHVVNSNYTVLGITSGNLFTRFGFSWSDVANISSGGLGGYSESNLQTLLKDSSNGSYYEIDKGVKHYVDSAAYSSSQYDMAAWPSNTVDPRVLDSVSSGPQLTRFIRGSSPTVYYIENGQKRGIPTESKFYSLGGSWDKVVSVSDEFLSQIPIGPIE